jgi:NAD(P)-dependent dehydrogenase (short-subunit alcohol dehydrogenase family)
LDTTTSTAAEPTSWVRPGDSRTYPGQRSQIASSASRCIVTLVSGPHLDAPYQTVQEHSGRIDVLVANAGGGVPGALGSITEEGFDSTFGTNVKGVLFTVQKALPLLAKYSSVILTGSSASRKVTAGQSVYAASKAAVRNFARSWILDLKGTGIRVNVLSPGPTDTPGLRGLAPAGQEQALLDGFAAQVPLGRVAVPDEIARAAVFLASDASSFVNGIEFFVDGGQAQI